MFSRGYSIRPAVPAFLAFSLLISSAILAGTREARVCLDPVLLASLRGSNQNWTIAWSDCFEASGYRDCSPGVCTGCSISSFQLPVMGGYNNHYYAPVGYGTYCGQINENGTCDCTYTPEGVLIGCYGCTGGTGNGNCYQPPNPPQGQ